MLFGRARRAEKAGKYSGFNPEIDVTIIRSICEIGSSLVSRHKLWLLPALTDIRHVGGASHEDEDNSRVFHGHALRHQAHRHGSRKGTGADRLQRALGKGPPADDRGTWLSSGAGRPGSRGLDYPGDD